VEATASGVVTQAGWVAGYGNLVEIKHDGGITTRYGHNSALLVSVGQEVDQGTVIALAGSTGNSTGPHCHYEVRINGDAVDPVYFLPANQ
jgi:murein DD-endopeptidase MepM/ murein hydrolase activator NlpD